MSDLVFGKQAHLDCYKTGRYGRGVCNVWVAPASAPSGPKTLDAGLTLGMAWWYRAYAGKQTTEARGQYEFAEKEARAKCAGCGDSEPPPQRRARQRASSDGGRALQLQLPRSELGELVWANWRASR